MSGLALAKWTKPIVQVTNKGLRFLAKNSNVILTMIGAAGVITTTVMAVRGTIKAVKLCEEKKVTGRKEVIETVWKCYIPTVGFAILTTTAIIFNGRINAKKLAVLTSAYSGSVEALKKLEDKMSEQIGPKKTQKAADAADAELAQAHAPKSKNDIVATGKGDQLFYCYSTGQWFYSDWNGIELANMKLKKAFDEARNDFDGEWVRVAEAQYALNLPMTEMGEYMGWYTDDFRGNDDCPKIVTSCDWMNLPWGREIVGIVKITPWPTNI